MFTAQEPLEEWLQKFIACWLIVGIGVLHYRCYDIGIFFNNLLAVGKVCILLTLLLAGMIGGLAKTADSPGGIPGVDDFGKKNSVKSSAVNYALATFLVLYSYEGWENASKSFAIPTEET